MTTTNPNKITPEEWRTAAKVARRSIFGNSELADAWENVAKYSAAADLTTELAKAYRAAENAVAPIQCEWDQLPEDYQELGRVGIRGVLEFLTSADRLLADDEMRLTAEQVEDVKIVLGQLERGGPAFEAAHERLRALFPATEPAEERCQSVSIFRERRALVPGHDGRHAANGCAWGYPPAPAEPAEEETKAEGPCTGGGDMHPCVLPAGHAGVHADSRGLRWQNPASSPVVPAPTETGPWQRIEDVPETVGRLTDRDGDVWEWDGDNWVTPETAILQTAYINRKYAPFVAAEEG